MADIHPVPSPSMVAGTVMDSAAPLDDSIAGKFAAATDAGHAWQDGAAQWADSPQGAGSGGFDLGFSQDGTSQDWPTDPSVAHQGP